MPYKTNAPKILETIHKANHVLIVSHEKPDGDTLGASLALVNYLTNKKIKRKHYCYNEPHSYFYFLPHIENIITDYNIINLLDHDVVITIDCGDLKRTKIEESLSKNKQKLQLINIDHHISNNFFGHHNLVVPTASSTSEIIYRFFEFHNIEINKYMATSLLTGILTDTSNFTNNATTQGSLVIASDLIKKGGKLKLITNQLTYNKNFNALKLWGKVLKRIEYNPKYNFAYTIITQKDLKENNVTSEEARDGLANFLVTIEDIDFIMVLSEEEGNKIKGSLRTTKEQVDVSIMAQAFGGGGHKKAAGFTVDGQFVKTNNGWRVK